MADCEKCLLSNWLLYLQERYFSSKEGEQTKVRSVKIRHRCWLYNVCSALSSWIIYALPFCSKLFAACAVYASFVQSKWNSLMCNDRVPLVLLLLSTQKFAITSFLFPWPSCWSKHILNNNERTKFFFLCAVSFSVKFNSLTEKLLWLSNFPFNAYMFEIKVGLSSGTWFQIVFAWVLLLWRRDQECAAGPSWL